MASPWTEVSALWHVGKIRLQAGLAGRALVQSHSNGAGREAGSQQVAPSRGSDQGLTPAGLANLGLACLEKQQGEDERAATGWAGHRVPDVDLICQQVLAVARNDANAVESQYGKHVINNEVGPDRGKRQKKDIDLTAAGSV